MDTTMEDSKTPIGITPRHASTLASHRPIWVNRDRGPINALPLDVFQMIITIRWREDGERFAILSSHVCRTWRMYILSMPWLWNRLEFVGTAPRWDVLEAKLGRSSNALLEIILGEEPFIKSSIPNLRRIMRIVGPHVARWKSLRFVNVPHKIWRILLDRLKSEAALRLERLEVVQDRKQFRLPHQRIPITSPRWDVRRVLFNLPRLRSLQWTNPAADLSVYSAFQNLVSLKVGAGSLDIAPLPLVRVIHQLLSQSPSLEILVMVHGPDNDEYTLPDEENVDSIAVPPCTHHHLRVLDIETTIRVRSAVIRTLILPRSQRFSRTYSYGVVDIRCIDHIARINTTSQLQVVSMTGNADFGLEPEPADNHYVTCLPSALLDFGNLRILAFRAIDFMDRKWFPDLGSCCPQLKWWFLEACRGYTVASIQSMVETRLKTEGMNPVEVLRIDPPWDAAPECLPTLEQVSWFSEVLNFKRIDDTILTYISGKLEM
ncbi:hypothetical protein FRC00_011811 [Tulasnella sp. 408]|nr:hypothetical protein FRC00_011811 [Tulasnella sp. 408]